MKIVLIGLLASICLSGCMLADSEAVVIHGETQAFSTSLPSPTGSGQEILDAKVLEILLEKEHKTRTGEVENYKLVSVFQKQKEYALVLDDKSVLFVSVGPDNEVEDFVSAVDKNIDAGVYEDPLYRDHIAERN